MWIAILKFTIVHSMSIDHTRSCVVPESVFFCGHWCSHYVQLKILKQKIEQDFLLARKYCLPPAWPFWRRPRSSVTIFWRSSVMIARLPCGQLTVGHDSGWFGLWTAYCGTLGCLCFLVVQQLFLGQASLDKDTHRQWQRWILLRIYLSYWGITYDIFELLYSLMEMWIAEL